MLELSRLKPPYTKEVWMAMIFNIRDVKKKGKHELELFFDVAKFQKPDLFFQFRFFNLTPEKKTGFQRFASVVVFWLATTQIYIFPRVLCKKSSDHHAKTRFPRAH